MAQDALGLVGLRLRKRHPHEWSAGMKHHPSMPETGAGLAGATNERAVRPARGARGDRSRGEPAGLMDQGGEERSD
jgi:hypothetical protein